MSTHLLIIIFSSQKNFDASYDSGHEDMDEDDPNDHDFPHVSLFSVAMMMRKKVNDYIDLQHYIVSFVNVNFNSGFFHNHISTTFEGI